jgi:hypothetical protein
LPANQIDTIKIDAAPASPTSELSTVFESGQVISTVRPRKSLIKTPAFDSGHTMTPHWSALIAPIRHLLFYKYVSYSLSYYLHLYHSRPIARARGNIKREGGGPVRSVQSLRSPARLQIKAAVI